jgi:hypothetical protein
MREVKRRGRSMEGIDEGYAVASEIAGGDKYVCRSIMDLIPRAGQVYAPSKTGTQSVRPCRNNNVIGVYGSLGLRRGRRIE